jgi:hypothetical protein
MVVSMICYFFCNFYAIDCIKVQTKKRFVLLKLKAAL